MINQPSAEFDIIKQIFSQFINSSCSTLGIVALEEALEQSIGLPVTVIPPLFEGGVLIRVFDLENKVIRRYVPPFE